MVRDVTSSSAETSHTSQIVWRSDGAPTSWSSAKPVVSKFQSKTGQRGDVVQSDGYRPTNYGARRREMLPLHADFWRGTWTRATRSVGVIDHYRTRVQGTLNPVSSDTYYGEQDLDLYSATTYPSWVSMSASGKVLESLADSDVNLGVFLGELPESAKMIASSSIKVLQAARAARRGQFGKIPGILGVSKPRKKLPGDAAGVWFAYKFGWEPLVTDVYNMHSAVTKQLNRPVLETRTREVKTEVSPMPPATSASYVDGVVVKGCKVGVSYRLNSPLLATLNSLGLVNPAAVAWELVPMSFVFDWFIPVGNFLDQLSGPIGLTYVDGYETRYASLNAVLTRRDPGTEGVLPSYSVTGFNWSRRLLPSWPRPSIVVDIGLNRNQLLTLSGLASQRVR